LFILTKSLHLYDNLLFILTRSLHLYDNPLHILTKSLHLYDNPLHLYDLLNYLYPAVYFIIDGFRITGWGGLDTKAGGVGS
jgi:hypothetical protein